LLLKYNDGIKNKDVNGDSLIMTDAPKANAVVGQSGGPTGVINASLVGVIEEVCKHEEIENLYGAIHAVEGIAAEQFIDLKQLSVQVLEGMARCPSAALGSSREKPKEEDCKQIFEVFKKRNVRYFFYIGGNDSAYAAHIINMMAADVGYEMRAFHIPKTIDNDLLVTDHCPGYGTAAKFVASALMGDDLDNKALPGIKVDVVMGRNAGFLAAAAALGRRRKVTGRTLYIFPKRQCRKKNCSAMLRLYIRGLADVSLPSARAYVMWTAKPGQKRFWRRMKKILTVIFSFQVPGSWPTTLQAGLKQKSKQKGSELIPLAICREALSDSSHLLTLKRPEDAAGRLSSSR
jgi:hypothetical protein